MLFSKKGLFLGFVFWLIFVILSSQSVSASKFVVVGHFRTLQDAKDIRELFIQEVKNISDLDGIIFLGDTVRYGEKEEWQDLQENVIEKINISAYFVPGNHEILGDKVTDNHSEPFKNYLELIGYTSKKVSYDDVNLYLLNSLGNLVEENFTSEYFKLSVGTGPDDESIDLLKKIRKTNKLNLLFMHHSLYSSYLWNRNETRSARVLSSTDLLKINQTKENEKIWKEEISPIIEGKVDAVFMGDGNLNKISEETINNITYYGNAFAFPRERLSYTVINITERDLDVKIKYISVPNTFSHRLKLLKYKIIHTLKRLKEELFAFFK